MITRPFWEAKSLTMFLYGALGSAALAPPGRKAGFGAQTSFHGPCRLDSERVYAPWLVAAHTVSPMNRSFRMIVLSSSVPPTRSPGEKEPCCGWARTYTPVPTNEVALVLASPVAYQSRRADRAAGRRWTVRAGARRSAAIGRRPARSARLRRWPRRRT